MTSQAYLPFRGLSGWFSCSINPASIQQWDHHGGTLAGEDEAMYLFSDDATTRDTVRVYETQRDIAVFRSSWIREVLQHSCTIHDIPPGKHLLLPHYLAPVTPPPPLSTSICTTSHEHLNNADSKWMNSRELHQQGNKLRPSVDDKAAQRPANAGVYSLSESATTMFVEYNATWEDLESRMKSTDLKDIADAVQVPRVANATLIDFVTSQPEFKIRRV